MVRPGCLHRVPFGRIAKMADTSEQAIFYVLKQILLCIDHTMEAGYTTKLDLRIGHLRFANEKFKFVNGENNAAADGSVSEAGLTSCNTDYRTNKRYLTNLRERPNGTIDQETQYSTVRDAISSIVSGNVRTPNQKSRRRDAFFSPERGVPRGPDSIFSETRSRRRMSEFHAANPNPQSAARTFRNLNLADYDI